MVKRILQGLLILVILISVLSPAALAANKTDYTSPYYSDTSNLKEVEIIDKLYEYGLMGGVIPSTDNGLGMFLPDDAVTSMQFYAIMNNLLGIHYKCNSRKIITHETALLVFRRGLQTNNSIILWQQLILPQKDKKAFTRIEFARLIYSYAVASNIIPAPVTTGDKMAAYALKYVGYRYVYGGSSPRGFDCSGFTWHVAKQFGYSIGRTTSAQRYAGTYVSYSNLQPGDIVLFERTYAASGCTHAGIYIGDNQFVHAANSRRGVVVNYLTEDYYYSRFVCGRRLWEE